jgi:hypothetical protein
VFFVRQNIFEQSSKSLHLVFIDQIFKLEKNCGLEILVCGCMDSTSVVWASSEEQMLDRFVEKLEEVVLLEDLQTTSSSEHAETRMRLLRHNGDFRIMLSAANWTFRKMIFQDRGIGRKFEELLFFRDLL